jgi:hypothetical protein
VNERPGLVLGLIGAALSLLSLADMPYGYYTFSRVALSALAVVLAIIAINNKVPGWIWGLAPIALLWNPAIPFHFAREIWAPLNLLAAVIFAICGFSLRRALSPVAADEPKP